MSELARSNKFERCLVDMDSILCCLHSGFPCNLIQLSKCFLCCSLKTARLCCTISNLDCQNRYIEMNNLQEVEEEEEEEEEVALSNYEKQDTKDEIITNGDINTVVSNLGVEEWRNVQKQDEDLIQEAHKFLDSKNASMEELKEAFYVFDRNEDGFISAFELWSVLRRLELKEGKRYEDCEEMIRVYDKDGDGRISFSEFKDMMEQVL